MVKHHRDRQGLFYGVRRMEKVDWTVCHSGKKYQPSGAATCNISIFYV